MKAARLIGYLALFLLAGALFYGLVLLAGTVALFALFQMDRLPPEALRGAQIPLQIACFAGGIGGAWLLVGRRFMKRMKRSRSADS